MKHRLSLTGLLLSVAASMGLSSRSFGASPTKIPVAPFSPEPEGNGPKNPTSRTTTFRTSLSPDRQKKADLKAERDLRACRLNYRGWCGFEESGILSGPGAPLAMAS